MYLLYLKFVDVEVGFDVGADVGALIVETVVAARAHVREGERRLHAVRAVQVDEAVRDALGRGHVGVGEHPVLVVQLKVHPIHIIDDKYIYF